MDSGNSHDESTAAYRIDVQRRERTDVGYEAEPWVAFATRLADDRMIAAQFGSRAGIAFTKALAYVDEDRQRESVSVYV